MKKFFAISILTASLVAALPVAHAEISDEIGGGSAAAGPHGGMGGAGVEANRSMRTAISLNAVQAAFDDSDPRANVVHFRYDQNTTYKLRLREYMDTTVVLPAGESVDGFSLADEYNFQFKPYTGKAEVTANQNLANIFTLSATRPGADTSLTVIGQSGRIYSFYMRSDSVKSAHMPTLVAYIEDKPAVPVSHAKPQTDKQTVSHAKPQPFSKPAALIKASPVNTGEEAAELAEYLRRVGIADPSKVNFEYGVEGGEAALAPLRVFDDGYFTYFQFSKDGTLDQVSRLPAIYKVVDGYDTPVNSRVEAGSLIAESIGTGWTLRNGGAHLCIRKR